MSQADVVKKYLSITKQLLLEEFKSLSQSSDPIIVKVSTMFLETLVLSMQKGWYTDQLYTELSFFGYGDKELYPSVITFEVYGFFQGQLIYGNEQVRNVDVENSSFRIPIGQSDVSESILEGVPQKFIQSVNDSQDNLIKKVMIQLKKTRIVLFLIPMTWVLR